ncbi:UNVERIFIED_CONTAM: DExH-box ATP-dependent RNA helicase DExH1 [Sesamum radiatum]|uniref:RNA helicase n=1 Tax=Sesamum radiatum TaxID=300843 RepID=A0AAW2LCW8_SESRA
MLVPASMAVLSHVHINIAYITKDPQVVMLSMFILDFLHFTRFLIFSSAQDADIDALFKGYSTSTRRSLEAWSGSQLDLGLVEATIEYICRHEGNGAILVFLTGWDDISKLHDKLKYALETHLKIFYAGGDIFFLSHDISRMVNYCGKAKETSYDALNKLACLLPSWISKASAHQRRGRAGRVQPGVCYRLYPKMIHDAMPQYQLPEMLRTPLQELCLHIKTLQLGAISMFLAKALQPPDPLSVENAIELLKTIGALDDREELTPLGRHLCTLPLDPNIGKMLLMGSIFQCLNPALTIAAALAHRDPFVLPLNRKEEADAAKRSFAGDSCSDHIALLKAFEGWKDAKRNRTDRTFCWENFLSPVTMQMMEDMRNQFLDLLSGIGFVDKSRGPKAYNQYSDDLEMVCAILCAGLYPNVVQCKRRESEQHSTLRKLGKLTFIRLQSMPAFIFSLFHTWSTVKSKSGDGIEMLGGYLHFSASKTVLDLIRKLRGELDKLLSRKIVEPGLDITVEGKGFVAAVVELLHSQDVRYR